MTTADRVYSALQSFKVNRAPLSLSKLATDVGAHEADVIAAIQELKLSGRVTFTGHSGSVPELHVIDGAA